MRLAVLFLFLASVASAQTIHQYPYANVPSYSSPAAWPVLSAQCHWRPGNGILDTTSTPQMQSPSLAHTHLDVQSPIYGEIDHNFTVPFTVMLFHVAGHIAPELLWTGGPFVSNVTWDTPTPPVTLDGDPNGLKMWTGHFTIDLSKADGSHAQRFDIPKHGWFTVELSTLTVFDNGDRTHTAIYLPFYSVIDPSIPEQVFQQGPGSVAATCGAGSSRDNPADAIGLWQVAQYNTYLPILAPINAVIPVPASVYGYGTLSLPLGTGMTRVDMDLHHGNEGRLLDSATALATDGTSLPSPFDPARLGSGTHKVAALWQQSTGAGIPGIVAANEQATGLLVVTVQVGGTIPVPDPQPQPQPQPEVWSNWILQHSNLSGNLRACPDASGVGCVGVMKN